MLGNDSNATPLPPVDGQDESSRRFIEHPVLFSGPMVRAILEGRKTQTRRVVKPQPEWRDGHWYWAGGKRLLKASYGADYVHTGAEALARAILLTDKVQPGDRLWVREAFSGWFEGYHWYDTNREHRRPTICSNLFFRATHDFPDDDQRWVPGIFMPRWASRITLEMIRVLVVRIQEIDPFDVVSEGFEPPVRMTPGHIAIARNCFMATWDELNAKRGFSWESNPWVYARTFRRLG